MMFLGIDPGASGGYVVLDDDGNVVKASKRPSTDHDTCDFVRSVQHAADEQGHGLAAMVESVHAMPKDGKAQAFAFGKSCGFIDGMLTALGVKSHNVTPQSWQGELKCRRANKNVSKTQHKNNLKAVAQRLWPSQKWTHATADAALIAEYARRMHAQGKL